MSSERVAYRELCLSESFVPLFQQAWWLDAACGEDGWDVALVRNGGRIDGALPYMKKRGRWVALSQPSLTPFLGPWLRPGEGKRANDYGRQKDLMTALIQALPRFDRYAQNWDPQLTNWLPFYWSGFQQTTRYTYVLSSLGDEAALWKGLRENIRTDIRKAEKRFGVEVTTQASVDQFLDLTEMTFARQGKPLPYSRDLVRRIDDASAARGCRKTFLARGADGRHHAGAFIVWDAHSAYYLIGGGDPELRNSGATSLCLWEAIRFAAGVTRKFNFEGSMIEPVERFFRAFGAEQVPYFHVTRTQSRALHALSVLSSLARMP